MKLLVPHFGEASAADRCLFRLAERLGGECDLLRMEKGIALSPEFLEKNIRDSEACLVVNPEVIQRCLASESFPVDGASYLISRFPLVLIHNLSSDRMSASIVRAFSQGSLDSLASTVGTGANYEIESNPNGICGAFSSLAFGPAGQKDQVLLGNLEGIRTHIAIGGRPFFASATRGRANVFFLASAGLADLDANIDGKAVVEYFSPLVPLAMFIRHILGQRAWLPHEKHATLIIDDPLLRKEYGFLNYERLLRLMDQIDFHTNIAFIPHNCRRNSSDVTSMFLKRPDRLSICFHGNDHTAIEFATKDASLLNAMLRVAEDRMRVHQEKTGVPCNRVMVFPQEKFSREAMEVLQAHAFSGAVCSSPYPLENRTGLTVGDVIEPAILKYGGFPLFLRKYVSQITPEEIAFNLFFGRPVLIVEHHTVFRDPACLRELVSRMHALWPEIQWSNLQTAVERSQLRRRSEDGKLQIRSFANACEVENALEIPERFSIEWPGYRGISRDRVLLDGSPWRRTDTEDRGEIEVSFELAPKASRGFSIACRNDFQVSDANRRVRWRAKAFLRRRFSEVRDNHLSKNPQLLNVAKALQRALFAGPVTAGR